MREADLAIGLTEKVARCFRDERNPAFVVHQLDTLLAQRIHGLVLGYEDLNDHDDLRRDPALGLLSDTLEPKHGGVETLAGKSTLNRLEHGLLNGASRYCKISVDDAALEQVLIDIFIAAHKTPPKRLILDLDATDDPLHGEQEGRFFHGYYRSYCYLPLQIFCGRHLLVAKLRRANIDASAGAREELARIVAALRKAWPDVDLEKGANPRFIVTSLTAESIDGKELYEGIYCARGEMENRIKECQLDLDADRTSAATMRANQLRLWFSSLAYVLMEAVRRLGLAGTELANATAGTIRLKVLKIGAVVTVSKRRIKLAYATACPMKEVFAHALGHLRRLNGPPAAAIAA